MSKQSLIVTIALCATCLTACADGVEINAPILERMGVNLNSGSSADPKVKARGDLVVPPTKKLPDPNAVAAAGPNPQAQNPQAWPDDPDLRRKRIAQIKKEEKRKKRDEIDFEKGDIDEFGKIEGEREIMTGGSILDVFKGDDEE